MAGIFSFEQVNQNLKTTVGGGYGKPAKPAPRPSPPIGGGKDTGTIRSPSLDFSSIRTAGEPFGGRK